MVCICNGSFPARLRLSAEYVPKQPQYFSIALVTRLFQPGKMNGATSLASFRVVAINAVLMGTEAYYSCVIKVPD
jgi:hypothetical protein